MLDIPYPAICLLLPDRKYGYTEWRTTLSLSLSLSVGMRPTCLFHNSGTDTHKKEKWNAKHVSFFLLLLLLWNLVQKLARHDGFSKLRLWNHKCFIASTTSFAKEERQGKIRAVIMIVHQSCCSIIERSIDFFFCLVVVWFSLAPRDV